jgi:hypothetical protein
VKTEQGAIPYIKPSTALMEQIVRRARALGGAEVRIPVFVVSGAGATVFARAEFTSPHAAWLTLGGTEVLLRLDEAGRITAGSIPAQNLTIERVALADR